MPVKMLTDPFVRNATAGADRVEYADQKIPGLYFIVQPSGHRSWAVRYRMGRHSRKYTIGPSPRIGLAAARTAAGTALAAVELGSDPAVARRNDEADNGSVAHQIKLYLERHAGRTRPGTHLQVKRVLERAAAAWAGRPYRSITKRDCIAFIDGAVKAAKATGKASANGRSAEVTCHKTVKTFFHWIEGREEAFDSPMRTIPPPDKVSPRQRALDDAEIAAVWRSADAAGGTIGALVKLLLLTGCRRSEILQLERSELKPDSIELPGGRSKNGEPLSVPLTPAMRAVLATLPKGGRFVLNGRDAIMNRSAQSLPRNHQPRYPALAAARPQATVATGMARIGIPVPVIEKCLNHKSGAFAGIVSVYQTHDFKREVRRLTRNGMLTSSGSPLRLLR